MTKAANPTVFGVPPGADFVQCLFERIEDISRDMAPEEVAGINVLVPTRRMQRRLKHLYEQSGKHLLLPRIGLVTDISHLLSNGRMKQPVSPLRRILDLKELVGKLVALDERLSASDVIDLTSSLAALLDEMHGEGVSFEAIEALKPDDQSGHWAQSLSFLKAIRQYAEALGSENFDGEALHRFEVETLCEQWSRTVPESPIILAGSTGSRATTRLLMSTIAELPNGEVILPGFDFFTPESVWQLLCEGRAHEDHPQFRFASFLKEIGVSAKEVRQLGPLHQSDRNALISLALRPAPVTDAWLKEGPKLGSLERVVSGVSVIEARDPKEEAAAIAISMRATIERGKSIALIAPDATLARRVAVNLTRWGIRADDSGGIPLSLSPSGRFLRQTAAFASGQKDPVELIALLKHPMTRAGDARGELMRRTQEFELFLRKRQVPVVSPEDIRAFGIAVEDWSSWVEWLISTFEQAAQTPEETLAGALNHHMNVVRAFAGGLPQDADVADNASEKILQVLEQFEAEAGNSTRLDFSEYIQLLENTLAADSAREQDGVRPDVMIWGSLEARVQGADVIVLGGLNEGTWPSEPLADPWLNRAMRREAGLLLPERQIGLAAHDFQQAVGADEVIITRSKRSEGSESVPSRWLNRFLNLLNGLETSGGKVAVSKMYERGDIFVRAANSLDQVANKTEPERRPAPSPPIAMRPRRFAVTDVKTLIQDPYALYARRILRLLPLEPLMPEIDARKRGIVFHKILEDFYTPDVDFSDRGAERDRLLTIANRVLSSEIPNPTARVEWFGLFEANADWLISEEAKRREAAIPIAREVKGQFEVPGCGFTVVGKADRIDRRTDGQLIVYDYKTGTSPSAKDITYFDRQLIIEAVMAEAGAFENVPPTTVAHVAHISVGRSPKETITRLGGDNQTVTVSDQLALLFKFVAEPEFGFVSGRAVESRRFGGDYDHLARFGEWDASDSATPEKLK